MGGAIFGPRLDGTTILCVQGCENDLFRYCAPKNSFPRRCVSRRRNISFFSFAPIACLFTQRAMADYPPPYELERGGDCSKFSHEKASLSLLILARTSSSLFPPSLSIACITCVHTPLARRFVHMGHFRS